MVSFWIESLTSIGEGGASHQVCIYGIDSEVNKPHFDFEFYLGSAGDILRSNDGEMWGFIFCVNFN